MRLIGSDERAIADDLGVSAIRELCFMIASYKGGGILICTSLQTVDYNSA
jgi:hypothetical protein